MFIFARLRLALLLVGLFRNAESRVVIRSDQKDISDNSQQGDQTFEYSYLYPETIQPKVKVKKTVKSVCTSGHEAADDPIADQTSRAIVAPTNNPSNSPVTGLQRVSLSDNTLSSPVVLDSLAIPVSSRAPGTGGPENLLTGKDLKPDFGFVNNKDVDGQLRKVTYGVDALGNIVANSAQVVNSVAGKR